MDNFFKCIPTLYIYNTYRHTYMYFNYHSKQNLDWNYSREMKKETDDYIYTHEHKN